MIGVDKKYKRLRRDVVAEYRRIITPLFYLKLKPKVFKRRVYKSYGIPGNAYVPPMPLPPGEFIVRKEWNDESGVRQNEKTSKHLDAVNSQAPNNILRISA